MLRSEEEVRQAGVAAVGWILQDEFRAGLVGEVEQSARAIGDEVGGA
jgi:hypothetical protein